MTTTILDFTDLDDLERQARIQRAESVIQADKQCRITLAETWPRAVELNWNSGGKTGRDTLIMLEPGKSVVQPVSKAQAWFGPFTVLLELPGADEVRKEKLRKFWAEEKSRYLNRYDYPRGASVSKDGYEPKGPHRSPDVTVTVIEADGSESPAIRLHKIYKIGEFDPLKDTFAPQETAAEVEARYKAELDEAVRERDQELSALKTQIAELSGLVKGRLFTTGSGK